MIEDYDYEKFENFDFKTFGIYFSRSFVTIMVMFGMYYMCPNIGKNLEYLNI